MASASSNSLSLASSSALIDGRASPAAAAATSPQCVSLPPPPPVQPQNRVAKTTAYCRKIARNVVAMATGEVPVLTREEVPPPTQLTTTSETTELPEMIKTVQTAWDKVEDKYAVSSLALAGFVAVWGSAGMISAVDRLPLIPGVMEVVGIGYTGWFAYRNLVFKPDRENLISKIKELYKEVTGTGS